MDCLECDFAGEYESGEMYCTKGHNMDNNSYKIPEDCNDFLFS